MNNLIKDNWDNNNINDFYNELLLYKNDDKVDWVRNVINTKCDLLAVPSPILRSITKSVYKGNYLSFLDLLPNKNHEALTIDAYLISNIKDFKTQTKYINKLKKYIDNWAVVDSIKYSIKNNEDEYIKYAQSLLQSKEPFTRRIGVRILFSYVNINKYYETIFDALDSLSNETHYYVNMAAAWLLCEMFISSSTDTYNYLKKHKTNKFIINKGISKCRDSYRVSKEDKEKLLMFKIK